MRAVLHLGHCSRLLLVLLLAALAPAPARGAAPPAGLATAPWRPVCPPDSAGDATNRSAWCADAMQSAGVAPEAAEAPPGEGAYVIDRKTYDGCAINRFSRKYYCPYRLHDLVDKNGAGAGAPLPRDVHAAVTKVASSLGKLHIVGDSFSHELADALTCLFEVPHPQPSGKRGRPPFRKGFVAFHHHKFHTSEFSGFKGKGLGKRDAVVLNEGIWYNHNSGDGVKRLSTQLGRLRSALRSGVKRARLWVWMDTPAQHFDTPTGDFPHGKLRATSRRCVSVDAKKAGRAYNFRNSVARDQLGGKVPGLLTLPAFDATAPLHYEHPSAEPALAVPPSRQSAWLSGLLARGERAKMTSTLKRIRGKLVDCSHYCANHGGVPHRLAYELVALLARSL